MLVACDSVKPYPESVVEYGSHVSTEELRIIGAMPVQVVRFADAGGKYMLAMQKTEYSEITEEMETKEIRLFARLYSIKDAGNKINKVWEIKDSVVCTGLDIEADFFTSATSITDLNNDGLSEVTVAYKMFCGGGVDPKEIKVIMRNGMDKYAIRGESLIAVEGNPPYGGTRRVDAALLAAPKSFMTHLDKTWQAIYVERLP